MAENLASGFWVVDRGLRKDRSAPPRAMRFDRPSSAGGTRERPRNPRPSATVRVGKEPHDVAVDGDHVWVSNSRDGTVTLIDARTNRVVEKPLRVGPSPRSIAASGGKLWVVNSGDGTVSRIDLR